MTKWALLPIWAVLGDSVIFMVEDSLRFIELIGVFNRYVDDLNVSIERVISLSIKIVTIICILC